MTKFLFFILTFCFLLQNSGAANILKKSVAETEQSSTDFEKGEEIGKEECKIDQEKNSYITLFFNYAFSVSFVLFENIQLYPSGFYSKPFLPPRILG